MRTKILLLTSLLFSFSLLKAAPPVEEGKMIFASRCAACHNINKVLTGPALAGVHDRRSEDWIISFVKSSQAMVKAGDKDALAVYEQFNRIPMPDHADLSDESIKNVIEYIKAEGKTAAAETAPFARPSEKRPSYVPLTANDYVYFIVLLGAIALLIGSLWFAVKVKEYARLQKQV